jgi:hypothetical protein
LPSTLHGFIKGNLLWDNEDELALIAFARFSFQKNSDRPNIELRINAFYDGSLDTFDMFAEYYPRKRRTTSELILWRSDGSISTDLVHLASV